MQHTSADWLCFALNVFFCTVLGYSNATYSFLVQWLVLVIAPCHVATNLLPKVGSDISVRVEITPILPKLKMLEVKVCALLSPKLSCCNTCVLYIARLSFLIVMGNLACCRSQVIILVANIDTISVAKHALAIRFCVGARQAVPVATNDKASTIFFQMQGF